MSILEEQEVPHLKVEVREVQDDKTKQEIEDSTSPSETPRRRGSISPKLQEILDGNYEGRASITGSGTTRDGQPSTDDVEIATETEESYAAQPIFDSADDIEPIEDEPVSAFSLSSDEEEAGASDDSGSDSDSDSDDAFDWNDEAYGERSDNSFVDTTQTHNAFGEPYDKACKAPEILPDDQNTTHVDEDGCLHRVRKSYVDGTLRETDIWIDWQGIRHEVQSWRDDSNVPRELRIWRDEQSNQHRLLRWLDAKGNEQEMDDWTSPIGTKHCVRRWQDGRGIQETDEYTDKAGIQHHVRLSRDANGNRKESDEYTGRDGYKHQLREWTDDSGNRHVEDMWRDSKGVERSVQQTRLAHSRRWLRQGGSYNADGQFIPTYASGAESDGEYHLFRADGLELHHERKSRGDFQVRKEELAAMPPHKPARSSRLCEVETVSPQVLPETSPMERFFTSGGFDWSEEEPDEYDLARFEQAKEQLGAGSDLSPVESQAVSPVDGEHEKEEADATGRVSPIDEEDGMLFRPTASGISFERPGTPRRPSLEEAEGLVDNPLRADTPFPETETKDDTEPEMSSVADESASQALPDVSDSDDTSPEECVDAAHQWWAKANTDIHSKPSAAVRLRMKRAMLKEQSPEAAERISEMDGDLQVTVHMLQADRFRYRWQRNNAIRKADERIGEDRERVQRKQSEIERLQGEVSRMQAHQMELEHLQGELSEARSQTESLITQVQTVAEEAIEAEVARAEKYRTKAAKLEEVCKSWKEQAEAFQQWGEENVELANIERARQRKSMIDAETQTPGTTSPYADASTETDPVMPDEGTVAAKATKQEEIEAISAQLREANSQIAKLKAELESRPLTPQPRAIRPPPIHTILPEHQDRKPTLYPPTSNVVPVGSYILTLRNETWKERESRLRESLAYKVGQEKLRKTREVEAEAHREKKFMIGHLEYAC